MHKGSKPKGTDTLPIQLIPSQVAMIEDSAFIGLHQKKVLTDQFWSNFFGTRHLARFEGWGCFWGLFL